MTEETLAEALRLAKLGPVFPAFGVRRRDEASPYRCACGNPACQSPGKHPVGGLVPRGLKDATHDPARIGRWWPSPHNLGFTTGAVIALDIDLRHDGYKALDALEAEHGKFPLTWRSETSGGGQHILFRAPPGRVVPNSANRLGHGVDVRGIGGFIIVPPSLHASGRRYAWSVDHHPDEVALAPMPEWLVEACAAPMAAGARFDAAGFVGAPITEGGRNARLTSICGYLMRKLPPSDALLVLDIVWGINVSKCSPPLSRAEVEKIVNSIAGRELLRRRAA